METSDWTIIGTGIVLAGLIVTSFRRLDARLDRERDERRADVQRLDAGMAELRERMAKLEGLLEGLREAITSRRAA